ncbi:MAG: hypothetical protein JXA21_09830 [Anaerolineae bacterium]|nr:hypothetical protein [Anaerolineae bacterium]
MGDGEHARAGDGESARDPAGFDHLVSDVQTAVGGEGGAEGALDGRVAVQRARRAPRRVGGVEEAVGQVRAVVVNL